MTPKGQQRVDQVQGGATGLPVPARGPVTATPCAVTGAGASGDSGSANTSSRCCKNSDGGVRAGEGEGEGEGVGRGTVAVESREVDNSKHRDQGASPSHTVQGSPRCGEMVVEVVVEVVVVVWRWCVVRGGW